MDDKEKDMNEQRLSLYKVMKAEVEDELLHGMKVANLAFLLAKRVGFSYERSRELAIAGFLHDLGKLQVAHTAYEQGKEVLEVEEMVCRRSHVKIGYDILMRYDYSDFILESILYHHENYDGSGYPRNLVATDIPSGARVLRIVNMFVALVSNRPYRKAFDKETAIELMIDEVKNFDMRYFLAFIKMIHEIDIDKVIDFPKLEVDLWDKSDNLL